MSEIELFATGKFKQTKKKKGASIEEISVFSTD